LVPAGLILFTAYLIRGMAGFGSALVAVPLLAHLLPLQFVVPMMLVLDLTASVMLGGIGHRRRAIRWREIGWLVPGSLAGILAGVALLVNLPPEPLLIGLGLFVIAFGLRYFRGHRSVAPVSRRWALPAGLIGGTVGAVFGTGGPPYVVYLSHRFSDKDALRATFSGLFLLEGAVRGIVFGASGLLLQNHILAAYLAGIPLMVAGLYAGHRVHVALTNEQMLRVIGALLVASGVSLLVRSLG
jgi:uncharacterized membrane protein YfcA